MKKFYRNFVEIAVSLTLCLVPIPILCGLLLLTVHHLVFGLAVDFLSLITIITIVATNNQSNLSK